MSLTTLKFNLLPTGLATIAEAIGNSASLNGLVFRPFNSIYNTYMDTAIPVTTETTTGAIASLGITLNSMQGNYLFDGIDIFTSAALANAATYSSIVSQKTTIFATSYISGSSVYVLISPQVQKYNSFTSTPNIINIQAVFEDVQPTIAATFNVVTLSNLLTSPLELPSVDQLLQANTVVPGTTMGSNLTLCGFDDASARVLAKLYEIGSSSTYSFSGMQPIATLNPSASTLTQATFNSTLLSSSSFASGRYIIQIVSGGNAGMCRFIDTITSTSNTFTLQWVTPLIGSLTTGTNIILYQSTVSILDNVEQVVAPFNSNVANIPYNQINVVDFVDDLPNANIYGTVNGVIISGLYLVGNHYSTNAGGLDSGYRSLAKSASNPATPKWSFDRYIPLVSYSGALGFNPESLTVAGYTTGFNGSTPTGNIQVSGNLQMLANYFSQPSMNTITGQNVVDNLFILQFLTGTYGNISTCRQVVNVLFDATTNTASITILLRVPLSSAPVVGDTFEILYDFSNTIDDLFMQLNNSSLIPVATMQSNVSTQNNNFLTLNAEIHGDLVAINRYASIYNNNWFNTGDLSSYGLGVRALCPTFLGSSSAYIYRNTTASSSYVGVTTQGSGSTVRAYVSSDGINYTEVAYGTMSLAGTDIVYIFFAVPTMQYYQVVSPNTCILWNEFRRY